MTDHLDWTSAADPARRIGHAIEHHSTIGSTNDRARAALAEPRGEGLAIVAELQTAGRGRRGRTWVSPPGVNLMVSVALRPRLPARDAWAVGAAAALAVQAACAPWAPLRVRWPNDLVAADGRKAAGMLVELAVAGERLAEAVIGIGINVNWRRAEMPAEIVDGATSLAEVAGVEIDRALLLGRLLSALDAEIAAAEAGDSPLARYRSASSLDGRPVTVLVGDGELRGTAAGIADDGSLLLDTDAGRVALANGEVVRVIEAEELHV
jgi:BirA family biotin operon repressor/biotin-[acetyl-CoA-carboxylase] ligase